MVLRQNASGLPADRFDPGPTPRADGFWKMHKKAKAGRPVAWEQSGLLLVASCPGSLREAA